MIIQNADSIPFSHFLVFQTEMHTNNTFLIEKTPTTLIFHSYSLIFRSYFLRYQTHPLFIYWFRRRDYKTNTKNIETKRSPHFPRTNRLHHLPQLISTENVPIKQEEQKRYNHRTVCVQTNREKREDESTLRPLTERSPLKMHSLSPVPRTITSYSTSIVIFQIPNLNPNSQSQSQNQEFTEYDESEKDEI